MEKLSNMFRLEALLCIMAFSPRCPFRIEGA